MQPTGTRHWRGRGDSFCQLDAWPGPRWVFASVFSQHLSPLEPSLQGHSHLFIFSPPFSISFSLWDDKGHKHMENHHQVLDEHDEAWLAVQTVQGHIRSSVHFLGILEKTLKTIWFLSFHLNPPDAMILYVSLGLIRAIIYKKTCFCFCFFGFYWPHLTECGILVPWPGIEHTPPPLQWKQGLLTTGLPGKFL